MKPQDTEQLEGFRLSPQQRRLWGLMQGREGVYHSQCLISLEGALRRERLEEALRLLVMGHEILRTSFQGAEGLKFPMQVIAAEAGVVWDYRDLTGMSDAEQRALVEGVSLQETQRTADVGGAPVLNATLFSLTSNRHQLMLTLPALRADKASLARLMRDIARGYGAAPAPPGDALQYADLAEVFNDLLEGDESRLGRKHWEPQADGGPSETAPPSPSTALPYARRLPSGYSSARFSPGSLTFALPASLSGAVNGLCAKLSVSRESFFLACWQLLVLRLSAASTDEEQLTAVLMDGRHHAEVADTVGLLARYVPLRSRPFADESFAVLVEEAERALSQARTWQEYFTPGEVAGVSPEAAGEAEAGSYAVSYQYSAEVPGVEAGGVNFRLSETRVCVEPYVLELEVEEEEGGAARIKLNYDTSVYEREEMERLCGQYAQLVESAAAGPRSAVTGLAVLGEAERERVVREWNRTGREYAGESSVAELFERAAAQGPGREAVASGGQRVSYGELNAGANRVAHYLRGRGVGAEAVVGVLMERGAGMVEAVLGVLKAGAAFLPLDPASPLPRLKFQLEDVRARILITEEKYSSELDGLEVETLCLDRDRGLLAREPETNPRREHEGQQLAYVIYTSGSTGQPKGVAISQQSLLNYTRFMCEELKLDGPPGGARLNFALVSTMTADLGNTVIFPSLVSGGCLHVLGYEVVTDSVRFADYFTRHRIDVLKIVPSHLNALLYSEEGAKVLPAKYLILGGEAFSFDLLRRIREAGASCEVINHYGPTETTVGALTFRLQDGAVNPKLSATVPIGRPIANTKIYVVDPRMNPVPVGVPGELWIGGAGLARGYLNRPGLTAERLVPDPFDAETPGRLYKTGDLVRYLPDGNVEFLGRIDQQVKIRGFRVEPGEIEAVLSRHGAVREAAVIAREDVPGEQRLVAYVVGRGSLAPPVEELRGLLEKELPGYMVPSAVIALKALPLTPNGKLDRRALPAPDNSSNASEQGFVAPVSPTEKALAGIWSEVLGLERVGVHDNFFQLGGDSILSIQIAAKAHKAGIQLTPMQLFQHPTISALAAVATAAEGATAPQSPGGEGRPPSQFPQVKLDQHQLELILNKVNKAGS